MACHTAPPWTWQGQPELPPGVTQDLHRWLLAAQAHPLGQEACGLLVGSREAGGPIQIDSITRSDNVAADPTRTFRVDAQHLMSVDQEATRRGLRLVGVWHSHPSGSSQPSDRDRAELPPGWLGWVVTLTSGGVAICAYG